MDVEKRLELADRADSIVADAARQNGVKLPDLLARAVSNSVRVHGLSEAGVFCLVEAYANSERQLGRLPLKNSGE